MNKGKLHEPTTDAGKVIEGAVLMFAAIAAAIGFFV